MVACSVIGEIQRVYPLELFQLLSDLLELDTAEMCLFQIQQLELVLVRRKSPHELISDLVAPQVYAGKPQLRKMWH